jgi:hypothetical protein
MNVQPVHLEILFLLRERAQTGLNVNAVYRELVARGFSRNKKLILNVIDDLEKGELIVTIKGSRIKRHVKQKKIKILTPLGDEIVRLADDLDEYANSCINLRNVIKQYFSVERYDDEKVLRNVLLNQGWKQEDIDNFNDLSQSSHNLLVDLIPPFQVISVVLIRYILVLSRIKDNKNTKTMLDYITMGNINKQLSNTGLTDFDRDRDHISLANEKIKNVTDFIQYGYFYGNKFTDKEVDNVLMSVLKVLDLPCDILKGYTNWRTYDHEIDDETGHLLYPPGGHFMDVFWFNCRYLIQHKISEKYGLRFDMRNLELMSGLKSGRIIKFKISSQIKRGSSVNIFVKIRGDMKNAYIDLLIVDPDNKKSWHPDPSSWDSDNDTGMLNLKHKEYSSEWTFTIPADSTLGEYKTLIILYEVQVLSKDMVEELKAEINDISEKNKKVLDFQETSFTVAT